MRGHSPYSRPFTLLYQGGWEHTRSLSKCKYRLDACALRIREPSRMRLFSDCMRTERLQICNFIDGEFVESIAFLSFRAKSRNLWIFLRAAWYDPNAF